jgi:hypothetical protein
MKTPSGAIYAAFLSKELVGQAKNQSLKVSNLGSLMARFLGLNGSFGRAHGFLDSLPPHYIIFAHISKTYQVRPWP